MEPKANFWIERDGQVALSVWRVALLEAIDETGSISAAAEKMGIHYRLAWTRVHEMEERLGVKLVETHTGGAGGGGAVLTPIAREYIKRFHKFTEGLPALVEERFHETFGDLLQQDTDD